MVPGTNTLLFTELSTVAEEAPARGEVVELDLDTGASRVLSEPGDLHLVEWISEDGAWIVEGVFATRCPKTFTIPSDRLTGRVATVLRERASGASRVLSTAPRAFALGFSKDQRAVVLSVPTHDAADRAAPRTYRLEAHPVDGGAPIGVLEYVAGLTQHGTEEHGLTLVPASAGRVASPYGLAPYCP